MLVQTLKTLRIYSIFEPTISTKNFHPILIFKSLFNFLKVKQCLILICDSNVINLFKISFFNCKNITFCIYSSNFVVILIKYNSYFLILIFSGGQELHTLTFSVILKFFILNIINVASFYYLISFDKTNWN